MSVTQPWCTKSHRTPTERKWYEVNESIYNPLKINAWSSPIFPGISTNHSDRLQKRFLKLFFMTSGVNVIGNVLENHMGDRPPLSNVSQNTWPGSRRSKLHFHYLQSRRLRNVPGHVKTFLRNSLALLFKDENSALRILNGQFLQLPSLARRYPRQTRFNSSSSS